MALHPVGPLAASTYWARRAALLVGVLVVLLLLRSCVSGGGSRPAALKASPTPAATPTATTTARPAPSRTTPPPVVVVPLCADTAVGLTATTDAATYGPGATPRITLTVKNTSAAACRRDVGSGSVELLVYSGNDRIWSTDDCSPGKGVSLVTLSPGGTQAVVRTWPGKRSVPGCGGTQATASAGTYRVVARVGTLRQDAAVFSIHA